MRRSPALHRLVAAGISTALLTLSAVGCATGPKVGVRADYRGISIASASVPPLYARSKFSLSRDELERRLGWVEEAALRWLRRRNVEVVPPKKTRADLESASEWRHFAAGGIFRVDLSRSFEDARKPRRETQVELLGATAKNGGLRRYVLFGELLYQTSGTCRLRADSHSDRAHVVVAPGTSESLPRPCIVTHVQARLVDARSGSTVWFNRRLRELHVPELNETWIEKNIRATVRETLGGDDGLGELVGEAGGES